MRIGPSAPVFLVILLLAPPAVAADIPESEWSRCAAVHGGGERLACFDDLAKRFRSARPTERAKASEVLDDVMRRCRSQMGPYGSSMVKACVDQDMEAHKDLQRYPAAHATIVDRCKLQMRSYGWSMVKACADQDIEAERALRGMRSR